MFDWPADYPCAWLLVTAVLGAALWSGSYQRTLTDAWLHGWGVAPVQLARGAWFRLFTGVFLTTGPTVFYLSWVMLATCLFAAETRFGSIVTASLFWGTHITTHLLMWLAVVVPLSYWNWYPGAALSQAYDVGPSAGYYGCLGALCLTLPNTMSGVSLGAIGLVLAVRLARTLAARPAGGTVLPADMAHMIAFPLGGLAGAFLL